jgi:hypothetical protein
VHGVAFGEQEFRQIGAILPGNTGNQRSFHNDSL